MPNNDVLALVVGVLTFGTVFGGLAACLLIAMKKKKPE
jgi:hypothetical protein